jgi:hypothetical protein
MPDMMDEFDAYFAGEAFVEALRERRSTASDVSVWLGHQAGVYREMRVTSGAEWTVLIRVFAYPDNISWDIRKVSDINVLLKGCPKGLESFFRDVQREVAKQFLRLVTKPTRAEVAELLKSDFPPVREQAIRVLVPRLAAIQKAAGERVPTPAKKRTRTKP